MQLVDNTGTFLQVFKPILCFPAGIFKIMTLKYNSEQRVEYLNMTERIGMNWLEVFQGNAEFYSAPYWDLLTSVWKCGGQVRKTDAAKFMKGIKSAQTAGKYVESATENGFLQEEDNPRDARSKLLALSPEMKGRLDIFFDQAVEELRKASKKVESANPANNP